MNEHTGFELPLSDYEKGFLTAYFESHLHFESYKCKGNAWYEHLVDENEWVGVQIGERMFDICIWLDTNDDENDPEYPQDLVACVHECQKNNDGEWTTDTSTSWFLREVNSD